MAPFRELSKPTVGRPDRYKGLVGLLASEPNHASLNTMRVWLGHESLDVTLAYLKGSDDASELIAYGARGSRPQAWGVPRQR